MSRISSFFSLQATAELGGELPFADAAPQTKPAPKRSFSKPERQPNGGSLLDLTCAVDKVAVGLFIGQVDERLDLTT
tara:strand:+ start:23024 stop:23254 length:231 start_codon:yes stop_codon:yes gene_type:complete